MPQFLKKRNEWIGSVAHETRETELEKNRIIKY